MYGSYEEIERIADMANIEVGRKPVYMAAACVVRYCIYIASVGWGAVCMAALGEGRCMFGCCRDGGTSVGCLEHILNQHISACS